jgi:hypothetical protein
LNPEDYSREDLIESLNGWTAGGGIAVFGILWIITLLLRKRFPIIAIPVIIVGAIAASLTIWFSIQCLAQFVSLATSWSLVAIAVMGGLATEILVWLYQFEKTLVKKAKGRWLLALRLGALAVLLIILVQPVRSFLEEREIEREIAILIDDSDSMRISDQRLTASQKLDRAELFEIQFPQVRPPLREIRNRTDELFDKIENEILALSSAPTPTAGLENRADQLPVFFDQIKTDSEKIAQRLTETQSLSIPGEAGGKVSDYLKRTRDGLGRILPLAEQAATEGKPEELIKQLEVAKKELEGILESVKATTTKADEFFISKLSDDERNTLEEAAGRDRLEVSKKILSTKVSRPDASSKENDTQQGQATNTPLLDETEQGQATDTTLLSALAEDYNLRIYRYDRDIKQITDPEGDETEEVSAGHSQTDLTHALEHVLDNTSPESLAGVLLLSDGRHNGSALPEDSLRQLAVRNTPLSSVPIGGELGPVDISILDLRAPESIYLDDRVVVTAMAKLDGFLGETVEAELLSGGEVVDTVSIKVTDVSYRSEIRFIDQPEEKGILDYEVRLQPDEREIFRSNNSWEFKVAVTDDRTNVLLVDGFPRWEFRYLRNLFYGRDKSVHLQYVLLDPDEIYRARSQGDTAASATRPFGEAEATLLPQTKEEWQLFDVIILGDIAPESLSDRDWKAIEEAVTKRGAMLVCIAGQRYMPNAHSSEVLQNLLPITYTPGNAANFESAESAYRIALTASGRDHSVTSQSTSRALNNERWQSFPAMRWRYSAGEVKATAEVLAYAQPVGSRTLNSVVNPDGSPGSVEAAIQQLANQETLEKEHALITTSSAGLGKVLMLNFDRTWRFRYGVGDTYHHRFWGQVTRWGAGPNLRSGTDQVRIGTDRLSYTPNDAIEVTTKFLDSERRPVTDAELNVEVWKDGERLRQQRLSYRTDSSGLYETSLTGLREEGEYELRISGKELGDTKVSTELLVVTTRNPIELAELTADRDFLNRAAEITGGTVAEINELPSLLSSFGAPKEILTERRNVTLWDTWPILLSFLGLITAEWIIRRRSGLV